MKFFPYFCNMIKNLTYILVITLILFAACTHKGISEKLDRIDSLVLAEKYDSAYTILLGIKESSLAESSDKAHYYLLQTQVGYLVNKPLATDSMLDKSIEYYRQHKDNSRLADGYYYKATREMLVYNYPQAILYSKRAEQLAVGVEQQYKIVERLAFLNERSSNYTLQLNYAKKSLQLASIANNKNWMAYSYNNIGSAFSNLDDNDSAFYYFNKVIPYINYIDKRYRAGFLTNIGMLNKEDFPEKAEEFFLESLRHKETSAAYENLADIYFMKGKQDEAYRLWKKALAIDDGDYKDNVIHSILSYDIEHGHVEKVCDHLDEIIHIKDSMLNKLKNDTIKDLQFRFDHEVSMRKQEQIISYWRIGGLVTLVIILLFIIYAIWEWDKRKDEKHCVQMLINDYISQIRELKASNKDVNKAIEELNKKIRNKLEELSPDLLQGQIYYEQILNGEIKTICNWTNRDEKLFVDYYKAIDYRTVHRIMSVKRKEPLTTHRLFYLLLKEMGKSDSQIQCLFSISDNGMKVLRSRTKEIK